MDGEKGLSGVVLPDVVLLEMFGYLPLEDLLNSRTVCKHWASLTQTDALWNRFLQRWIGLGLELSNGSTESETPSAFKTVINIWNSSCTRQIGKERWYRHPLKNLCEEYEYYLREAEDSVLRGTSSVFMYLRLNPCYEFTTRGNDIEDVEMRRACEALWENFGNNDERCHDIASYEDSMKNADFQTKHDVMTRILRLLEPDWFLDGMGWNRYELDEECNIVKGSNEESIDIDEEDLPQWSRDYINKRLPAHLWQDVKKIMAHKSDNFISYFMSEGCINENYHYGHFLYISNTAVCYYVQYYDL